MRLISQDGMIDVPYEISALSTGYGEPDRKYNIYIRSKLLDEKPCVFATYSTKSKALKVMEMLREQYQYGKKISVPQLEESGISKDDDVTLFNTRMINDFFKGGTYLPVKVFKFPADEEVEV